MGLNSTWEQASSSVEIPGWLTAVERTFQVLVFAPPGFLIFELKGRDARVGRNLYLAGLIAYLASYLALIAAPSSGWSESAIGFSAGAWTTAPWLAGIGLVCGRSWLPIPWHRAIYLVCASIFVVSHTAHALLIQSRVF